MKNLTKRQTEILSFIRKHIEEHKYPPTLREIGGNFGISSKGAFDHIKALEKKNKIRYNGKHSRTIEILEDADETEEKFVKIPLLGDVAAGIPILAEENFSGYIPIAKEILKNGKYFALNVKGDSMLNAGILDGDIAIIQQRNHAENGDIIVARLNDEAVTLKRFYLENNRIKLKAENPVYPPIYTQNINILGKLHYIVRNYE